MEIIKGKQYFKAAPIQTLRDLIIRSAQLYPDHLAFSYHLRPRDTEAVEITYRSFIDDIQSFQRALLDLGQKGKHIAVLGSNSYEWVLTQYSVCTGLSILFPLDRLLPPEEIIHSLNRGEIETLVAEASFFRKMSGLFSQVPTLKNVVVMNDFKSFKSDTEAVAAYEANPGPVHLYHLQELLTQGREARNTELLQEKSNNADAAEPASSVNKSDAAAAIGATDLADFNGIPDQEPDEVSMILFTSGTSQQSKAVALTGHNLTSDVRALILTEDLPVGVVSLSILPMHHTFENTCGVNTILYLGGCICICDGLRYLSKNLQDFRPTVIITVPLLAKKIAGKIIAEAKRSKKLWVLYLGIGLTKFLKFFGLDLRRQVFRKLLDELGGRMNLWIIGGASMDARTIRFYEGIGITSLQGYGLTETSPVIAGGNFVVNIPGSVGPPLATVTIAVDNEQEGESGEILVKGPMVMKGYYKDPDATKAAFDADGWFHTGDVGHVGKKQCLYVTGRIKSMIVLGNGKKIFPEELEDLLNDHEIIKESIVFGQHAKNGDVVITTQLVLDPEKVKREGPDAPTAEERKALVDEVIDETNAKLPPYKKIRAYYYSFDELAKTTSMKIRRGIETERILQMLADAQLQWYELTGGDLEDLLSLHQEGPTEAN